MEQRLNQAVTGQSGGQLRDAECHYLALLRVDPLHPDANHNMGVLTVLKNQPAASLSYFMAALEACPARGKYWLSYIEALFQTGQTGAANDVLALARKQGLHGFYVDRLARQVTDDELIFHPETFVVSENDSISPAPREIEKLLSLFAQGCLAEAESLAKLMTARYSFYGLGWKVLGAVHVQTGQSANAFSSMQKAAALLPHDAEAHSNLGITLHNLGLLFDAEASYRSALDIDPVFAEAHNNLGMTLKDMGRLGDACVSFRQALQIKPDYPDALSNLGFLLYEQRCLGEAEACLKRVLNFRPDCVESHCNLSATLLEAGQVDEAEEHLRQALKGRPDFSDVHSNLIFVQDLMTGMDIAFLQNERKRWNTVHAAHLYPQRAHRNRPDPERRLRIGYVSADFRMHSAAYVFGTMLVNFDPDRFEVFAYSNSTREDLLTRHFQKSVTQWRKIAGLSDDAVAELIRQDEIDILVDLSGHSSGNRLLVFARKPAPIQITAWGYIGGTGLNTMDVFFADPVVVPPEEKQFYAEQVRYLPCAIGYFHHHTAPEINVLPAMTSKGVTFGSFNRLVKNSQETYRVWAEVLQACPDSRMIIKTPALDDAGTRGWVTGHFTRAGIAPERIILQGNTSRDAHMAAFNQIDIALDPFPHGGGVTALEGMMMGVPVVTLRWGSLVGRLSATILSTLGLSDWIAETPEQYVEIALRKAGDLQSLAALRQQLRGIFTSSIIGDQIAYVKAVEQEYRLLWREWCSTSSIKKNHQI